MLDFGLVHQDLSNSPRIASVDFAICLGFRLWAWGLRVQGSGYRFQGAGFKVQGSGFRDQGPGFRVPGSGFRVWGSGFGVWGSGFRAQCSGCRVQGSGFRVPGSGFKVQGLGFRVSDERGVAWRSWPRASRSLCHPPPYSLHSQPSTHCDGVGVEQLLVRRALKPTLQTEMAFDIFITSLRTLSLSHTPSLSPSPSPSLSLFLFRLHHV